ncbi:hypothetical protein CGZ98_03520 [Enemella evansiae]|uniref:hypothetical protein n=1 Tax=Enemella evansiae TaxID=2016499 RepID=UPI000B97639F|nr:hypothetical protein [Enemella evansiae]OYO15489.1 hypothetical protein CGZ98_03520 [Enemella evansiae]
MMNRTRFHFRHLAAAVALGCMTATSVTAVATAADPVPAPVPARTYLPFGVWETELDFGGGEMVQVQEMIEPNGMMCHVARSDVSVGYGIGTWSRTGHNRFSISVDEKFYDLKGQYFGYAALRSQGTQTRSDHIKTWTHSTPHDKDGNPWESSTGWIQWTRVTPRWTHCPAEAPASGRFLR